MPGMVSNLSKMQFKFSRMLPRLIDKAHELGFEVKMGECWRTPEQAALNAKKGVGIRNSLHIERLAVDLLLFKNGQYLTRSEDYRALGEWWESQGGAWGGRFNDGGHFSLAYGGRK